MAAYIHDYVKHFNLDEVIKYNSTVKSLQKEGSSVFICVLIVQHIDLYRLFQMN